MKKRKKIFIGLVFVPIFIFSLASVFLVVKKDAITQNLIQDYSENIQGRIEVEATQISPFKNFPYISVDLQTFKIYEDKNQTKPFISIEDVYVGFDVLNIIQGDFKIKSIQLENGEMAIVQHLDESYNVVKAFESLVEEAEDSNEATNYSLEKIQLKNIHFSKLNTKDSLKLSAQIETAKGKLKSTENQLNIHLDTELIFNLINAKDTSFLKNKYMELHTDFSYNVSEPKIAFEESELVLENGVFRMNGSIDIANDADVQLEFKGLKENFDLFIALAPPEVEEALSVFENQGDVFFEAKINGKSINGFSPLVEAKFGCKNGFLDNLEANKKLSDLNFVGSFTNGKDRNLSTSEVQIQNFSASPEAGIFKGDLRITNFVSPEIDLQLDSDFDLNFLTRFFNLNDLRNLTGQVQLKMNFNDIIDLENPELALEEFNQAYYSELEINNLNFTTDSYHLPIKDLNIKAKMDGNLTQVEFFKFKIGESDLALKGELTHLPDIIHRSNKTVEANLQITSDLMDFTEITTTGKANEKVFDEKLFNFRAQLKFNGAANTFQVSESLPIGTFYIEGLFGKFQNYPHELHDFFARIYIRENELEIVNFKGMVDDSDIHFTGKLENYNLFLVENPKGDAVFKFDVDSNLIRLKDVFSYGEENYVPEDYRDEVLREINADGNLALHFQDSLQSSDFRLANLEGRMRIHPLKFKDFSGRLHFENQQLRFEELKGKIGKSHFSLTGNYYLGKDEKLLEQGDEINFKAAYLDVDELTNYKEPKSNEAQQIDHDDAFNIFEVPFRNMQITASIGHLNYHKYNLTNFSSTLRMQANHYIYVEDMRFEAAGGKVALSGYFNGSNPDSIYMHPNLKLQKLDLDQLLFKFDNFGQDQVISENLHGIMTGEIEGKVFLHTDLTPYVNKSNLQIDVSIENGMLENFEPMQALSDFFDDKNLNKVLFGSLENRLELRDGSLVIPNMVINSSLGYMQLSGKQSLEMDMDYYLRIPLKMVTKVAAKKLFGSSKEKIDPEQEDEIIYKDESENTNYVNLRMKGEPESYSISLRKNRNEDKGAKGFDKGEDFLFEDLKIEKFEW